MDFAVVHTIKDAAAWDKAIEEGHPFPAGFTNPVFVVAEDKSRAFCIWHASDREALQQALDTNLGAVAINDVVPVTVHRLG